MSAHENWCSTYVERHMRRKSYIENHLHFHFIGIQIQYAKPQFLVLYLCVINLSFKMGWPILYQNINIEKLFRLPFFLRLYWWCSFVKPNIYCWNILVKSWTTSKKKWQYIAANLVSFLYTDIYTIIEN